MRESEKVHEMCQEQLDQVHGGALAPGMYRPGRYTEESKAFFRQCVGAETYELAMNSAAGRMHHYVPARAFLSQPDWEKFVWIEQYGSLEGYPE